MHDNKDLNESFNICYLNYFWSKNVKTGNGLSNLGNTCFMNAVLQCLSHTVPLINLMIREKRHKKICKNKKNNFCGLCFFESHTKNNFTSGAKGAMSPTLLFRNLRIISCHLRPGRQHDAHEFLTNFLDNLERAYELDLKELKDNFPKKLEANKLLINPIKSIFMGEMLSQVKCTRCGHCSNNHSPFYDLSVDIQGKSDSLSQAIDKFFKVDKLDGDNKYMCSKCNKKVDAEKRCFIKRCPNNLTIHLKRFSGHR